MCVFFFKQKTAYEMRISDWSSDVCSSDLPLYHVDALAAGYHPGPHRGIARDLTLRRRPADLPRPARHLLGPAGNGQLGGRDDWRPLGRHWRCRYPVREPERRPAGPTVRHGHGLQLLPVRPRRLTGARLSRARSEEHTSELQSLMRISYAVFCLKKK